MPEIPGVPSSPTICRKGLAVIQENLVIGVVGLEEFASAFKDYFSILRCIEVGWVTVDGNVRFLPGKLDHRLFLKSTSRDRRIRRTHVDHV